MDPKRWQRIKDLFHRAVELETSRREDFLNQAGRAEPSLVDEVRRLLGHHSQAGSFIEQSAAFSLDGEDHHEAAGRELGAYRLLRRIGHGGMGTVFLAERSDDQYQQRVAIKLIRLGMDSPHLIARFRQERQILAHLEHPGIARLLDGGTLDDGLPYLVMEYIEGEPIDQYCQGKSLSTTDRLELFCKVCEAVQFAHRNLVIHRDIKPSNVLVTADGAPKLLDFGTAKLLDPLQSGTMARGVGGSPNAAADTVTGLGLMTPRYASPEQLRSEAITTATDIYALGVVLYELLTETRPFDLPSPFSLEAVRILCEQPPPTPSAALELLAATAETVPQAGSGNRSRPHELRRLSRRLQGDLDTIVLTAMRKEPTRRYPSVEQLAGDVERHLRNLPLVARPDTWSYRWGKFLRRHRTAVLTASAAALFFCLAILAWASQNSRARAADARAVSHAAEAETVTQFLLELFAASDPGQSRGAEPSARELLERGVDLVERATGTEPAIQARLFHKLGQVYLSIGALERADELLGRALTLRRQLGTLHEDTAAILLRRGRLLRARSEFDAAEAATRESLALLTLLFGEASTEVAESLDALGELQYVRGNYEASQKLHSRSRAILSNHPNAEPEMLAQNLNDLGAVFYALGQLDAAETHFLEAVQLRRRHQGEDHFSVALTLDNLAAVAAARQDFEQARVYGEEALALSRRIFAAEGHRQVATTLTNLGGVLHALNLSEEAETHLLEALSMKRQLLGPRHRDVAASLNALAVFYQDTGAMDSATDHYQQACKIWSETLGESHGDTRSCLRDLSWHLHWSGDSDSAERLFRRQMSLEMQSPTPDPLAKAALHLGLGLSLAKQGKPSEALPHLQEGYRLRTQSLGDENHPKVVSALKLLEQFLEDSNLKVSPSVGEHGS